MIGAMTARTATKTTTTTTAPRASADLYKKTARGLEEVSLSIDGRKLEMRWQRSNADDIVVDDKESSKAHADPHAALARELAARLAAGFIDADAEVEATPAKPAKRPKAAAKAKPKTPAKKLPAWIAKRPELAKLARIASANGLADRWNDIVATAKPAIDLVVGKALPADAKPASRVGGTPHLPPAFRWPAGLGFVAQLQLADFRALDLDRVLPASGSLVFFAQIDPEQPAYGDRGQWIHVDAPAKQLVATPGPTVAPKARGVTGKLRLSLPPADDLKVKLTEDQKDAYHDTVFMASHAKAPRHQLLGWPNAVAHPSAKFTAQFDSSSHFELGDFQTLRFYGKNQATISED
jgi:hypothetical protein